MESSSSQSPSKSFIAMEYYLGILNRTYRIYITPTVIAGGVVQNITASPGTLIERWFEPTAYVYPFQFNQYDRFSPLSDEFIKVSPQHNFRYPRTQILECRYDPTTKWGMGNVAHSGKLYLKLANGKKREFILLGLQQGFELLELMQKGRISEETAQKYSEIHQLLDQLSVNQFNTQLWLRLSDRFASLGEKAQEKYCLAYCQPTDPFAPKLS